MSTRERIAELLERSSEPLSAEEIAALLGLDRSRVREVYEHLAHIAKTVRRSSGGRRALLMVPPRCRACGYVFRDLKKPRRPSKCPRCGSQRIEPPRFAIGET